MIIWFLLSLLIILGSFLLAIRSMSDFRESPDKFKESYGLFFIRHPQALTTEVLRHLHTQALQKRFVITVEKLYKGPKQATVSYLPRYLTPPLEAALGLVELEDYTRQVDQQKITVLEFVSASGDETLGALPAVAGLDQTIQLWWQIVLEPAGNSWWEKAYRLAQAFFNSSAVANKRFSSKSSAQFYAVIRLAVAGERKKDREEIWQELIKRAAEVGVWPLASAHSNTQKLNAYAKRSLPLARVVSSLLTIDRLKTLIS